MTGFDGHVFCYLGSGDVNHCGTFRDRNEEFSLWYDWGVAKQIFVFVVDLKNG